MFKKSYISIILCVALFFIMSTVSFAQSPVSADKREYFVDEETARKAAILHVIDICHSDPNSTWNDGVIINKQENMYDFSDQLTAYLFYISHLNNKPAGYIVINASKTGFPVIEFSQTEDSYFYEIQKLDKVGKSNSNKLYYLGGMNYFLETQKDKDTVTIYDLSNKDLQQVSDSKRNELQISYDKENETLSKELSDAKKAVSALQAQEESVLSYFNLWNAIEASEITVESSSPPSGNVEITNPSIYESGYETCNVGNAVQTAYENKSFYTTSLLRYVNGKSYPGNCGPVAATNLMQYYKYYYDNKGWECKIWMDSAEATFVNLCSYLPYPQDTSKGGTDTTTVSEALRSYALSCGDRRDSKYYSKCEFDTIKQELLGGHPVIYNVFNHGRYVDHSMVAFAFREYVYSGFLGIKSYSRYLLVADGWTTEANRYVHYDKSNCSVNTFFATSY